MISRQYVDTGHSAWGHVEGWAAEPAMTAPEALARPLRATAEHSADLSPRGGQLSTRRLRSSPETGPVPASTEVPEP